MPDEKHTAPSHEKKEEQAKTKKEARGNASLISRIIKTEAFRLTSVLFIIIVVVSLLLSVTYGLTEGTIAENAETALNDSLRMITSAEAVFEDIEIPPTENIEFVKAVFEGGEPKGYCVLAVPKGFADEIRLLVGFDEKGAVSEVSVLKQSETPGLGTRVTSESFLSQFAGKNFKLEVNSKIKEQNIDGLTGATISSRAVTAGVNAAISLVSAIMGETN